MLLLAEQILTKPEIDELTKRLGYLNVVNPWQPDHDYILDLSVREVVGVVMVVVGGWGGTLACVCVRARTRVPFLTLPHPSPPPPCGHHQEHEHREIAKILIELAIAEPGACVVEALRVPVALST